MKFEGSGKFGRFSEGKLESFRLEDEKEYEIFLRVFARFLRQNDTPETYMYILLFVPKKLVRLFILKEVKPTPDSRMIKRLTFGNLFPPLRHSR